MCLQWKYRLKYSTDLVDKRYCFYCHWLVYFGKTFSLTLKPSSVEKMLYVIRNKKNFLKIKCCMCCMRMTKTALKLICWHRVRSAMAQPAQLLFVTSQVSLCWGKMEEAKMCFPSFWAEMSCFKVRIHKNKSVWSEHNPNND